MKEIAIQLRAMQFYAHKAHHQVNGVAFFGDHEFLGELYLAYEIAFDSVVERMIGLGLVVYEDDLNRQAVAKADERGDWFFALLEMEKVLRELCQVNNPMAEWSVGTQNLVAQLADDSEQRTYKIGQRVQ